MTEKNFTHDCSQSNLTNQKPEFCIHCGEKLNFKKLVLKDIILDFSKKVLEFDLPLMNTVKQMIYRPGRFCREYIEGNRSQKYNPVQFYVLTLSIYFFLYFFLGVHEGIQKNVSNNQQPFSAGGSMSPVVERFNAILFSNIKYFSILLIPCFTLIQKLIFKKEPYNKAETLTFVLFLQGESSFLSGVSCLFFVFSAGINVL